MPLLSLQLATAATLQQVCPAAPIILLSVDLGYDLAGTMVPLLRKYI